jgi:hypothetical protein
LEAFLRAPNLRDPTNLALGEIAILLHFLHDTPERGIALSRLIPPQPPLSVQAIWDARAPHLGTHVHVKDFFCGVLACPPLSLEERELAVTHLHERVSNHISEATLRAYTKGDIEEAAMPQCSSASKRGREGEDDTEDTGASSRQPPSVSQTAAIPPATRASGTLHTWEQHPNFAQVGSSLCPDAHLKWTKSQLDLRTPQNATSITHQTTPPIVWGPF